MKTKFGRVNSQSYGQKSVDRRAFLKQMSAVAAGAVGTSAVAGLFGAGKASAQAVFNGKKFEPPIAKTIYGAVRGASQDGVILFKGIPYAGPSTGANRFKPPVKLQPWTGVRDALMFGPETIQPRDSNLPGNSLTAPSDEYCQYLNVWTPMIRDGRKRPVMFYSHGGGFTTGNGGAEEFPETEIHDGGALARNYDVVVVTHNHRLGLLGYLYLGDILGEEYAASGCAGMLDIAAALQWVHDNIEEFGGDPNCVMIYGESGGGAKTSVLTALPAAHGLFCRASVESGSMIDAAPGDRATELARKVLAQLGLKESNAKQLLTIPVEQLLAAQVAVDAFAGMPRPTRRAMTMDIFGFGPVLDGHFLPANPYDPGAPAISANIPMMVGTNKDETNFMFMRQAAIYQMDKADLEQRISDMFGDKAGKVLDVYRHSRPGATPTELFIAITTASMFWNNAIRMAERKAEQNAAPIYMYQFTYESNLLANQDPPYPLKASHAMEIPIKFDHPESPLLIGTNPDRFQAALNMSHAWASFAHNGNPNFDGLPNWPAYTLDKRETMLLNAECHVVSDPQHDERELWKEL